MCALHASGPRFSPSGTVRASSLGYDMFLPARISEGMLRTLLGMLFNWEGKAEAYEVVPEDGRVAVPTRRTAAPRIVAPTATTEHAVTATRNILRTGLGITAVRTIHHLGLSLKKGHLIKAI